MVQGVVTGVRGLCGGLGPAMFGFIFYLFDVNLNEGMQIAHTTHHSLNSSITITHLKYNINNNPSSSVITVFYFFKYFIYINLLIIYLLPF